MVIKRTFKKGTIDQNEAVNYVNRITLLNLLVSYLTYV